ncbi:sigma-70 family RNA polymerase sigma factor [Olivibacter sp. SA151]|uniref:RNA polymerase sigma factor n=1 Tax=Olivibacter jilunii TaxID=985016 RepID=UPI003F17A51D
MHTNQYHFLSDKELIAMLTNSDKHAFDTLYHRYSAMLLHYLSKLLMDEELVQDLLQNIFVSLWERRKRLPPIESLKTYLFNCAKYQAVDVIRKQVKQRSFEQRHVFPNQSVSPIELQSAKELAAFLEACTRNMPKKTKEIFDLSRNEQLNHKTIADRLHIAPTTVKKQINNALKYLRYKLSTTPFWNDMLLLFIIVNGVQ